MYYCLLATQIVPNMKLNYEIDKNWDEERNNCREK